jgi:glycosyltransferase involved in cell wall biosynthesis
MSDMHVMHVIDSMHGGGAEISLLEMAPGLMSRGIRTSIVTLLADDGVLEDRLSALGLTRIRLEHRDPLRLVLDLRNIIRAENPDLLHTTLLFANLAGRLAARTTRTPVVTTLANQDYGPEHRANSHYGPWAVRAVQAADMLTVPLTTRFHAISADVAGVMSRRLRIPTHRIRVVYRGRDQATLGSPTLDRRLRIRTALSIDAETPVVLSVARLDRQKGVDTTVDAFRYLSARLPGAVLLVAGRPGNSSAVVRAKADGRPEIRLLGHRKDVPDLMCAADVLSFPSRWEGLGGTLIEAMALRLPIVASDIPPVAETIGDVGWPLVLPDDSRALAQALVGVLECGAVNEAKKDAGQRRFHVLFTAEATCAAMAELYQDVLRGTSTTTASRDFGSGGRNAISGRRPAGSASSSTRTRGMRLGG